MVACGDGSVWKTFDRKYEAKCRRERNEGWKKEEEAGTSFGAVLMVAYTSLEVTLE